VAVRFLGDTCILSTTSKQKPDPVIVKWISTVDHLALPMGALVEFEQGIYMAKETEPHKYERLLQWRVELLATGIMLLDTDYRVALKYGEMRACRKLKGLWYPDPKLEVQRGGQDLHIAAAAIAHGYCVATDNVDDFLLIHQWFKLPGLYNPKTDIWHVEPNGLQVEITALPPGP
jgi:predicted nucleic acid-binding protein